MRRRGARAAAAALALAAACAEAQDAGGEPAVADEAVRAHRFAIERAEASDGPWAESLEERYGDLGHALWRAGAYRDSLDAWRHALHLQRMAEGLHGLGQRDLARRIAENHLRLGDWDAADRVEDYIWQLHRRAGVDAAERFAAGIYRARWQMAYRHYSRSLGRYLDSAATALDELERQLAGQLSAPQRRELLRAQASVHYHLADAWRRAVERGHNPDEALESAGAARSIRERPAPNRGALKGRERLAALEASYPAGGAHWQDRVLALLALADWETAFISWQSATATYRRALNAAMAHGAGEGFVRAQLSKPARIVPAMPELPRARNAELKARFDVDARGRVRNVELLGWAPANLSRARLLRYVAGLRFRPRFAGGAPARTNGVNFRQALDRQALR